MATNCGSQAMESDSTDERFVRALRAYEEAATRDPRVAGCGYLAGDPATRAVGSFVWFPTPAEMFDFLAGPEVDLLQFDDDDARRMATSVRRVLRGVESVARVDRDLLSACFEGWSGIVWLGSFVDLRERGGSFPTALRASFGARTASVTTRPRTRTTSSTSLSPGCAPSAAERRRMAGGSSPAREADKGARCGRP